MAKARSRQRVFSYFGCAWWIGPRVAARSVRIRGSPSRAPAMIHADGRGRDEDFSSPPAQIPACAANAPGSSLGSDVVRWTIVTFVARRAAIIRIDAVFRLSV